MYGERAGYALMLVAALAGGCSAVGVERLEVEGEVEATSFSGEPLVVPELPEESRKRMEAQLDEARAAYERDPDDVDAIIWLGRRQAYLWRYREAIDTFTLGIAKHPEDARLLRHRGHRHITTRRLELAIADLERAAALVEGRPDEVEPDGQPNARNIPTSTLQFNVFYHLGLARYLAGDLEAALDAYRRCLEVSKNPDTLVATSYWLHMTLSRLGREAEAAAVLEPITAELDVIENDAYLRLLLIFKGLESPAAILGDGEDALQNATLAYGVGAWHLWNGRTEEAVALFRGIVSGDQWNAFGYIAAEAELHRLGGT